MSATHLTMLVPPGWTRFDLTSDVEAQVGTVGRAFAQRAPLTKQPVLRRLYEEQIAPAVRALAGSGVDCALLAIDPADANPVRPVMCFTATTIDVDGIDAEADTASVIASMGSEHPDSDLRAFGDMLALRWHSIVDSTEEFEQAADAARTQLREAFTTSPGKPGDAAEVALEGAAEPQGDAPAMLTARVSYLIGSTSDHGLWLSSELSVKYPDTNAGLDLANSSIGLYDAVVSTVRWSA